MILTASKQMDLVPLLKNCSKFILQNSKGLLEGEGFKNLTKESVVSIISQPVLRATDEEVFGATMSWGKTVLARSGANGVGAIVDAVSDLLPHLRLDEIAHAFLFKQVQQAGVFPPKCSN
jgi:hypothetical protein